MADLANEEIQEYWSNYPDPVAHRAIVRMESLENWTLDGAQEVETALTNLVNILSNQVGSIYFQEKEDIIKITSYLKFGRVLYLLQLLDNAYPGAVSQTMMAANTSVEENEGVHELFLRRLLVWERLRILARIFAEEHLQKMIKILEKTGEE